MKKSSLFQISRQRGVDIKMKNSSLHLHLHLEVRPPVSVPALTFVVIVMCLGVIGNGLVLMVYGGKIQKNSNYRSFVLTLAWIDMAACCLGMPSILVDMLRTFTFYSDTACKLLKLISHAIVSASAMTHLLIGIERHRKICKPLKKQLSTRGAKVILLAIVLLSFIIALPAFMFYGRCKFEVKENNITVSICTIVKSYIQTPLPAIYESTLFSLQVITALALFVVYILIARQIWKTKRAIQPFLKRFSNEVNINEAGTQILGPVTEQLSEFKSSMCNKLGRVLYRKSILQSIKGNTNASTDSEPTGTNKIKGTRKQENDSRNEERQDTTVGIHVIGGQKASMKTLPSQTDEENEVSEVFHSRNSDCNDTTETASTRTQINRLPKIQTASSKSVKMHSRKVTAVSVAITFVFIISYVPYFIVIWASVKGHRHVHMTSAEEALYRISGISYIINNAANAFVYYLMDNDFRTKCKQTICRCCAKP